MVSNNNENIIPTVVKMAATDDKNNMTVNIFSTPSLA